MAKNTKKKKKKEIQQQYGTGIAPVVKADDKFTIQTQQKSAADTIAELSKTLLGTANQFNVNQQQAVQQTPKIQPKQQTTQQTTKKGQISYNPQTEKVVYGKDGTTNIVKKEYNDKGYELATKDSPVYYYNHNGILYKEELVSSKNKKGKESYTYTRNPVDNWAEKEDVLARQKAGTLEIGKRNDKESPLKEFKNGYQFGDVTKTAGNLLTDYLLEPVQATGEAFSKDPIQTLKTAPIGLLRGIKEDSADKINAAFDDFMKWGTDKIGLTPEKNEFLGKLSDQLNEKGERDNKVLELAQKGTNEEKKKYLSQLKSEVKQGNLSEKKYSTYEKILTTEKKDDDVFKKIGDVLDWKYTDSETYKKAQRGELDEGQQNVYNITGQVGSQIIPMAASTVGSPAVGKALFWAQAQQGYTEEAKARGYNDKDARKYGLIMGTVESLVEEMGFDQFAGLDAMAEESLIKAMMGESMEEFVTPYIDYYVRTKFGEDYDLDAATNEAIEGAVSAAWTTLIMSSAGKGMVKVDKVANKINNGEKVTEKETYEAVKELEKNVPNVKDKISQMLYSIEKTSNTELTENEKKVVDNVLEERIEEEYDGKISNKEKETLRKEIQQDLKRGYISTDTIERTLGGETYNQLSELNKQQKKIQNQIEELQKKADNNELESLEEKKKLEDLKKQIQQIDNTQIRNQLTNEVQDIIKNDKGLQESYLENQRRKENFYVDLNTIKDEKQRAVYQKAMETGVLNNSNKTHALVDMIAKISSEKGINFDFTNNEQLEKSGFGVNGRNINGYVTDSGITINLNSQKAINRIVGHELTHTFEGTTLYTELQNNLKEYLGDEWYTKIEEYKDLYKNVKNANIENELTSDLVGDYLFTDENFVRGLSTKNKNLFEKVYDEIKYLYKVATAGSKEQRQLEKVKRTFEKIYKETKSKTTSEAKMPVEKENKNKIVDENGKPINFNRFHEDYANMSDDFDYNKSKASHKTGFGYTFRTDDLYTKNKSAKDVLTSTITSENGLLYNTDKKMSKEDISKLNKTAQKYIPDVEFFGENMTEAQVIDGINLVSEVVASNYEDNNKGRQAYLDLYDSINKDGYLVAEENGEKTLSINRIKNIDKLNENSTEDVDARYSLDNTSKIVENSEDEELSEGQKEYFKNSKAVTDDGRLWLVHHGTPADFTIFDINKAGKTGLMFGNGFYFTNSESRANAFTEHNENGLKSGYINIEKPASRTEKTMSFDEFKNLYKALNENPNMYDEELGMSEIDALLSDYGDIYDDKENTIKNFYDSYNDDVSLIDNLSYMYNQAEMYKTLRDVTGYDGIIVDNPSGYDSYEKFFIAFNPDQFKLATNENPTADSDIRYSISQETGKLQENGNDVTLDTSDTGTTGTLMAIHNLSEDKLKGILELGGFPVPSIAITNPSKVNHSQFGNISVLFDKSTIDPAINENEVYDRDVWSPTFPQIDYELNDDAIDKVADELGIEGWRLRDAAEDNSKPEYLIERLLREEKLIDKYIEDNNLEYETAYKDAETEIDFHQRGDKIRKFIIDNDFDFKKLYKDKTLQQEYFNLIKDYYDNSSFPEAVKENLYNEKITQLKNFIDIQKGAGDVEPVRQLKRYQDDFDLIKSGENKVVDTRQTDKNKKDTAIKNGIEDYLKEKVKDIYGEKGIRNDRDYLDSKGNRRSFWQLHDEYNLENIVDALTQGDTTGTQNWSAGFGQIQANMSNRFNSINDIKANENRLTSLAENNTILEEARNNIENDIDEIVAKNDTDMNIVSELLADFARGDLTVDNFKELTRNYYQTTQNVPDKLINKIIDDMNALKNIPTDYFEAKPQRAVGLDEVQALVIPNTTSTEFKKQLQDSGLQYTEYDPNIEGDRQRVINQFDNLKFSLDNEQRINQNNDIVLSQDSQGRELSKEQQEYFKDEAPEVLDRNGNLQVLYHGTPNDFTVFDTNKSGDNGTWYGAGIYLTSNENYAQDFSGNNGKVMEVYAHITNPYIPTIDTINADGTVSFAPTFIEDFENRFKDKLPENWEYLRGKYRGEEISNILKNNGYDGIIVGDNYVVFESNQVKNVDNLNPTSNDDIRYSLDIAPISKNFLTEAEQDELDGLRAVENSGFADLTPEESRRMLELENRANTVLNKKAEKMLRNASYKAINTTTKIAQNYLDFDAKEKKSFRTQLREFSNMTKDELVNADTYNKVKDIVSQYANKEVRYVDESIQGIQRELKHTKIKVTDELKNQITDYGYFVKDSKLMLRRNSGQNVDTIYKEYSEMYPGFFDKEVMTEADQLEALNNFVNNDFSVVEKFRIPDSDLQNATDLIYNKLLENSLSMEDLMETEVILDKKAKNVTRREIHEGLLKKMGITPETIQVGNDISPIAYQRTDPVRLNEKVFGWETGQLINDATVNFTKHQEAERIRFLNQERQEIKDLGIKARSKESELVQKYGEKQYVDKDNVVHKYGDEELARDVKDEATREKIKYAAKVLRQKYDMYLDMVNEAITQMGYDEIPKRQDYMRHFVELNDKFSRWGLPFNKESMMAEDLPTDINGLTEFNKPGRSYFASANARTGLQTTYDAITGIDGYLEGVSNWIYHTESIQRYRALSRLVRETFGREHGLDNMDLMTDEELADRIKDVQGNKLSKYAAWIDEQANAIAGKKAAIDRSIERALGRRVYTALNTLKSQVGSNMTGFNVRSAMTNFASAIQGASKTKKLAFVQGTISTINNIIHNDGMIDKSDFLTRRFGSDSLAMKPWQKLSKAGQVFMEGTDYFTANQIWRSKYYENLNKGMSEEQAIKNADDFASRIMGDRSKGAVPEIFNSKTLGFLSQFQLEVNNQWSSLIHDNKIDIQSGNKTALGVTFELGQLFAASYMFNTMMKSLTGSSVMIDPIDMMKKIFFPDDDDEEDIVKRAQNVLGDFINDLPFVSVFTGGRIPIGEAFKGGTTAAKKLMGGTDNYGNEISWDDVNEDLKDSLAYWLLPTGWGQIKKTTKGLSMYDDKLPVAGSYTKSGNLRFSAEDTTFGKIKAGLFGQYSSKYAQDYIDSGYKTIRSSNLDEMKDLDMNSTEYREYREGLSDAGSKIQDKLNYISSLDVSDEDKSIMASNVAKKDIDMSEYKKYGTYEEFNYAQKNPAKYKIMQYVGGYDTYKKYAEEIENIKADYDIRGNAISNSRKRKVIQYVNSLNLTRTQKAMLIKEQYPSFTKYDNEIASYIDKQNINFIEKAGILKQLGFKAYDKQIINYIKQNYRTVEEQQEELEKLGFKVYNYNGKTYVR